MKKFKCMACGRDFTIGEIEVGTETVWHGDNFPWGETFQSTQISFKCPHCGACSENRHQVEKMFIEWMRDQERREQEELRRWKMADFMERFDEPDETIRRMRKKQI